MCGPRPSGALTETASHSPSRQYLAPCGSGSDPIAAPKGTDPGPCELFPCKQAIFRGPPEGAMIAVMDPRQADAVVVAKALPPLWQYFSPCSKSECARSGGNPEVGVLASRSAYARGS